MEEEGIWDSISAEENRQVWDETEDNFWKQFEKDKKSWHAAHDTELHATTADLRLELSRLTGERTALSESQARLARELAKVEEDLRNVGVRCEGKSNEITQIEEEHREKLERQMENWRHQSRTMTNFFRAKRGDPPLSDSEPVPTGIHASAVTPMEGVEGAATTNGNHAKAQPGGEDDVTLVDVVDADGNVIGPVKRIEPWNQWVEAISKLPIQRQVKIRRGRRFSQENLASIYDRSEAKGVKWLSCMIQAIGKIQSKRCQSCDKNQGAFENCIIVGGDLLQKCGNCEWNRQGCHGASGETIDIEAAEQLVREREEQDKREKEHHERERMERERLVREDQARERRYEQERLEQERLRHADVIRQETERREREILHHQRQAAESEMQRDALTRQAMAAEAAAREGPWKAIRADPTGQAEQAMAELHRRQHAPPVNGILPSQAPPAVLPIRHEIHAREHAGGHAPILPAPLDQRQLAAVQGGFTPANQRSRPPSRETTSMPASVEQSPQPGIDHNMDVLDNINRHNIALRHDGVIYTYPECMAGVPLVKVYPGHPYWNHDWKDVRAEIVEAREKWRQKHQAAIEAEARQEKTGSSKYQIGRQVNRGTKIIEFLDDDSQISPYQLLGKRYMHSSKGGITSYDTLFRLCETLSELSKFSLDVAPVDWLRHRLYEIMKEKEAEGEKHFNLPKTVHDFYHDPKLTALRHKHGFKNIGRPSGQGKELGGGRQSLGSANGTPKPSKKRKSAVSHVGTPKEQSYMESPLGTQMIIHDEGPFLAAKSQQVKRPKHEGDSQATTPTPTNGVESEHTDKDSVSGEKLRANDFQVRQIKMNGLETSPKSTQRLTWVEETRMLEHFVLSETALGTTRWTIANPPTGFCLRLDDMEQICYHPQSLRVLIHSTKGQGPGVGWGRRPPPSMVQFKREHTLKRFLTFCETRKLPLQEIPLPKLDDTWIDMRCEQVPSNETRSILEAR